MSEEEKEAIEETRLVVEHFDDENYLISYRHENLSVLLNYIDKLQKENKELRNTNKILYEMGKQSAIQEILNENWVNKNKIRTKIKELEEEQKKKKHISNLFGCTNTTKYVNINNEREIKILKELLGEE